MAEIVINQGPGLITDPSALNAASGGQGRFNPSGVGMRIADNVVLTRAASLSPRPGFGDLGNFAIDAATPARPVKIAPYGADAIVQSDTSFLYRASNATPYGAGGPQDAAQADVCFAEDRDSMYASTAAGVRKWTSPADTAFDLAGSYNDYFVPGITRTNVPTGQDDYAVGANGVVAYRWVWVRKDANGYIRRSAPSPRLIVRSAAGAGVAGEQINFDRIPLPKQVAANDTLEIYRSYENTPSTATPGTDYFLAITYTVTAADVTAKYIANGTIRDDVRELNLGATLYASSSQFGINKSNETPPRAGAMAVFNDCMWYGNVTERASVSTTLTRVRHSSGGATIYDKDGIQVRHSINSATFTAGATTFTLAPADTDGLIPGMYVMDVDTATRFSPTQTGTYVSAETKLVSVNSGTGVCVMDKPALASGNPIIGGTLQGVAFGDIVTINSQGVDTDFYASHLDFCRFYAANAGGFRLPEWRIFLVENAVPPGFIAPGINGFSLTDPVENSRLVREFLGYAIQGLRTTQFMGGGTSLPLVYNFNLEWGASGPLSLDTGLSFIQQDSSDGAITITCNRINALGNGSPVVSEQNRQMHRVYYSRADLPEAVPFLNFIDVGEADAYIKQIVPLRDALLVFKDDGVFRISGSAPDAWAVDALERDVRLLHPECTAVMDGRCYALTDRGLAVFNEGGLQGFVSAPIAESLRFLLPANYTGPARGFGMTTHPELGLILLQVHSTIAATGASDYYVYHVARNAWTKWARTDRCCAYSANYEAVLVAPSYTNDVWQILQQRTEQSAASTYADQIIDIAGSSVAADVATVTKAAFNGNVPQVGDILSIPANNEFARITNVADFGATYGLTCEAGLSNGVALTVRWYQGYQCTMQWQASFMGPVGRGALWQEMQMELLGPMVNISAASYPTFQLGGINDQRAGEQTVSCIIKYLPTHSAPVRIGTPRAIARGAQFYPVVKVWNSALLWGLGPLSLTLRGTSTRVGRKAQM